MEKLIIRNEKASDKAEVEAMLRNAFWDVYMPGCSEHYLAHVMREHKDFIPELDLVAELDGKIIGSIMYARSVLEDVSGNEKDVLTFGPLGILPEFQRKGAGKALMERSFAAALEMGYEAVVIFGNPGNYVSSGFKSCKKYNVCLEGDVFPTAMLVKELKPGALDGRKQFYCESPVYNIDISAAEEFDKRFEPREKGYRPSQEEFFIYSHSLVQ